MNRLRDIERFYAILGDLQTRTGPFPHLRECHGRMNWPARGVYFFFEDGEERSTSGVGPRVVRIGTHALTAGSRTTLWDRLSQHRGPAKSGGGNHRGSVFRLLVGEALMKRRGPALKTWGLGGSASDAARATGIERDAVREQELPLEVAVSETIGAMRVAWIQVDDLPGTTSLRGTIERNAIGLLSNWSGPPVDAASSGWLGKSCDHERVPRSGLWNNNHVEEVYDATFLDELARAAAVTGRQNEREAEVSKMAKAKRKNEVKALTHFEQSVLDAVVALGGHATHFRVAEHTGMTWDSVKRVMRRMWRNGILVVDEVSGPAYCGGGKTLIASVPVQKDGRG